eukprot:2573819-Pleurochrysis_carterae.AAC.2
MEPGGIECFDSCSTSTGGACTQLRACDSVRRRNASDDFDLFLIKRSCQELHLSGVLSQHNVIVVLVEFKQGNRVSRDVSLDVEDGSSKGH